MLYFTTRPSSGSPVGDLIFMSSLYWLLMLQDQEFLRVPSLIHKGNEFTT